MNDWFERLSPEEQEQWEDFVHHTRTNTVQAMDSSAFVLSLLPSGDPDIKFAVELGLAIMMDKPIIALAHAGRPVSEHLRRVVDKLVEIDMAELDTEAGQAKVAAELQEFITAHEV